MTSCPRPAPLLLATALAVGLLGCSGSSSVSTGSAGAAVRFGKPPVRATLLVSLDELFPGAEGPRHVFEIHGVPATPGDLLIVGSHGAAWIDGSGHLRRRVELEGAGDLFPVRAVWSASSPGFLAHTAHRGDEVLQLFDSEGRRTARAATHSVTDLFAADLRDDGVPMAVAETASGQGVAAFDLEGRPVWSHDAGAWVTDLDAVPAGAGRSPGVFVYLYPVGGAGEVRLLDGGSGQVTATWSAPVTSDFAVAPEGLWTLLGDELVLYGFDGDILDRLPAPQAARFAQLETRLLGDGRRVTLASGDGHDAAHAVWIHAPDGRLLYRRVEEGHGRGLHVMESAVGPVTVYYGVGDEIWSLRGV